MRCTSIFGHKWGGWVESESAPKKETDGRFYRQIMQSRKCDKCDYGQVEWLPLTVLVDESKPKQDA